eukprot:UC4_evm1s1075
MNVRPSTIIDQPYTGPTSRLRTRVLPDPPPGHGCKQSVCGGGVSDRKQTAYTAAAAAAAAAAATAAATAATAAEFEASRSVAAAALVTSTLQKPIHLLSSASHFACWKSAPVNEYQVHPGPYRAEVIVDRFILTDSFILPVCRFTIRPLLGAALPYASRGKLARTNDNLHKQRKRELNRRRSCKNSDTSLPPTPTPSPLLLPATPPDDASDETAFYRRSLRSRAGPTSSMKARRFHDRSSDIEFPSDPSPPESSSSENDFDSAQGQRTPRSVTQTTPRAARHRRSLTRGYTTDLREIALPPELRGLCFAKNFGASVVKSSRLGAGINDASRRKRKRERAAAAAAAAASKPKTSRPRRGTTDPETLVFTGILKALIPGGHADGADLIRVTYDDGDEELLTLKQIRKLCLKCQQTIPEVSNWDHKADKYLGALGAGKLDNNAAGSVSVNEEEAEDDESERRASKRLRRKASPQSQPTRGPAVRSATSPSTASIRAWETAAAAAASKVARVARATKASMAKIAKLKAAKARKEEARLKAKATEDERGASQLRSSENPHKRSSDSNHHQEVDNKKSISNAMLRSNNMSKSKAVREQHGRENKNSAEDESKTETIQERLRRRSRTLSTSTQDNNTSSVKSPGPITLLRARHGRGDITEDTLGRQGREPVLSPSSVRSPGIFFPATEITGSRPPPRIEYDAVPMERTYFPQPKATPLNSKVQIRSIEDRRVRRVLEYKVSFASSSAKSRWLPVTSIRGDLVASYERNQEVPRSELVRKADGDERAALRSQHVGEAISDDLSAQASKPLENMLRQLISFITPPGWQQTRHSRVDLMSGADLMNFPIRDLMNSYTFYIKEIIREHSQRERESEEKVLRAMQDLSVAISRISDLESRLSSSAYSTPATN